MKKIIKFGLVGLLVLVIAVAAGLTLVLNKAVKHGVELIAPRITKTNVKLEGVSLSLLSGGGALKGFVVGSPEGYEAPSTMAVGEIEVSIQLASLMSDKYVVRSIRIIEPEITFEGGLRKNNLTQILKNVERSTGGGRQRTDQPKESPDEKSSPEHKIQVDEFILSGARVKWAVPGFGGRTVEVVLPTLEMKDLGTGEEGITIAELAKLVTEELTRKTVKVLGESAADVEGLATEALQGLGTNTVEGAAETIRSLGNLFKRNDGSSE